MKSKGNIQTLDERSDQTHEQSARVLNLLLTKVLTYNQSSNICNGQVKKVDIGSSPHVLIANDENAGGEVTKHSNNQEDAVDDAEWEKG